MVSYSVLWKGQWPYDADRSVLSSLCSARYESLGREHCGLNFVKLGLAQIKQQHDIHITAVWIIYEAGSLGSLCG